MSSTARRSLPTSVSSSFNQPASFQWISRARDIVRQESEALSKLAQQLPIDFAQAVQTLLDCSGAVMVTGVGKAGWIGQKISASLASTGTPSHFLHPAEAFHGDLGRVGPRDVILVFSNSGETSEILQLLPSFEKLGTPIIAITGKAESTLAKQSHAILCYGKTQEACHLGLAPTTSTALMLSLGDALTLVTSEARKFRSEQFAKFHPGGSLGKMLSEVEDVMRPISECRTALETETVREIYVRSGGISRRAGVVLITDNQQRLTGLFTDSDLARLLARQRDDQFDKPIRDVMTQSPITIAAGSQTKVAIETLACRNLSELPVVNADGVAIGLIDITDVVGFC